MRCLFSRYDSVVKALHEKKFEDCQQCGIRLDEHYGVAHQKHMDWHIKEMRAMMENKYSRSTPWFMNEVRTYQLVMFLGRCQCLVSLSGTIKESSDRGDGLDLIMGFRIFGISRTISTNV